MEKEKREISQENSFLIVYLNETMGRQFFIILRLLY